MSLAQQNKNYHGIAAPLFSLHTQSSSGIGEYLDLIPLIDWCQKVGLNIIQLLPLNDTGPIISPYSPLSAFALNPIYLSMSPIAPEDSLKPLQELTQEEQIPYEKILELKEKILRDSFKKNFLAVSKKPDFQKFFIHNFWLYNYARFKILKERYHWKPWKDWPEKEDEIDPLDIEYHTYVQYLCFSQMEAVKKYADEKGVMIKGDIPFLITLESADAWEHPDYFLLDLSAGAPPDQYNEEGQNWSAPIYNWDEKFDDILDWWRIRLQVASNFYHLYRLDHVVGLFRVWAIPEGSLPVLGYYIPEDEQKWIVQGRKILEAFLKTTSMKPIAEDLGIVPDEVREVLKELGIPGTKVMRWEKDPVYQYPSSSMTTVSTHDTETLLDWLQGEASYDVIRKILFKSHHSSSQYHINLLHEYFSLIPNFSRKNERINIPGKVLDTNWRYRFRPSIEEIKINNDLEKVIRSFVVEYKNYSGSPQPLGASSIDGAVNFAFYSHDTTEVVLELFNFEDHTPLAVIYLDPKQNRTGNVWHVAVQDLPETVYYAYRMKQSPDNLILDPYAKGVNTSSEWGSGDKKYQPLGLVPSRSCFNWEGDKPLDLPMKDLVIYELHVRGFTEDISSDVVSRGNFLGVVEKIPYLKKLGVNAVKLMPVQEFNECEYKAHNPTTEERLYNFWGYSTVNFFSTMNRYGTINEFKMMVKALHKQGIEVILDIVFNHTGEGFNDIYSFLGIDPNVYYMLNKNSEMLNYSGCGNTLNCNHPIVRRLILTCLEYWVSEMHVDGFRFDLASIFSRGSQGELLEESPLLDEISEYPILAKTKLIAEPWDMGGLYQLGTFYKHDKRWSEWNDKYRDSIRRFLKGDSNVKREFATRLCGSQDIYGDSLTPCSSINFITAHDGFTLRDLVSYDYKHNMGNGENDRDGNPANMSWNCGVEGETTDRNILYLRERQMRNFHLALMISQGVPMLTMGNEYGHTRYGNNNSWCQDNRLNWFLWDELKNETGFFRFYQGLLSFRNNHSVLRLGRFLTDEDIDWHGKEPFEPNWDDGEPFLAFSLDVLYVAFNATDNNITITLPQPPEGSNWHLIVNTANTSPNDFYEETNAPILTENTFEMISHSAILLKNSKTR